MQAAADAGASLSEVIVVHGDCPRGADAMAANFVYSHPELRQEPHPANWRRFGRRAGFVRNELMVRKGATICLAFIRNGSAGTSMCTRMAQDADIPIRRFLDNEIVRHPPWETLTLV